MEIAITRICIVNNGTFSLFAQFLWIWLIESYVGSLSDSDGWLDIQISYSICAWPVHYFTPVYVLWVHTGSLVDSLLNFTECMKQNDYKIIWTMRFFYMTEQLFFYSA